jgi:elongation factor 1 alpha-like protein
MNANLLCRLQSSQKTTKVPDTPSISSICQDTRLTHCAEQLQVGTIAVRAELPSDSSHITDQQIQDALWHYYYDIQKSVGYLVNTYMAKPKKENKKTAAKKSGGFCLSFGKVEESKRGAEGWMAEPATCSKPFSVVDFFKDMPWLNIPLERQAIFVEPLYPRGGLLGGSSDGAPKMSKLQALAAARKKKAQEQNSGNSGVEKPMSELSLNGSSKEGDTMETAPKTSRGFPLRKRKDSNPHEKSPQAPSPKKDTEKADPDTQMDIAPVDQAEPSAFASTMFSSPLPSAPSANLFTLPYTATGAASTDPFAGPSPDDVVIAAQSKGPTLSGTSKK